VLDKKRFGRTLSQGITVGWGWGIGRSNLFGKTRAR
jgi:hypothetical protein